MNWSPNNWVPILWTQKLMEIRVVVKGVRFVGVGIAWRHPFGRQAPYQAIHVVFYSRKMLFFILFAQRNCRAVF